MISTLLEAANPEELPGAHKARAIPRPGLLLHAEGPAHRLAARRDASRLRLRRPYGHRNEAVGAYINGRHVPIDTHLRNGDEVVIETSKGHLRPAAWEAFAVTGRARAAIRRAAREAERKRFVELGRQLVSSGLAGIEIDYSEDKIKAAAPKIGFKSADDLLAAVGRSDIVLPDVLAAIAPSASVLPDREGYKPTRRFGRAQAQDGWFNLDKVKSLKFRSAEPEIATAISIGGPSQELPVAFEPGGAVPGDRIVGVMARGEGIRVFQIHSPRLKEYEEEQWIDVTWDVDPERPQRFPGPNQRYRCQCARLSRGNCEGDR